MKNNAYNNEKIIENLRGGHTSFLTIKEFNEVKGYLHKDEYKIYEPYKDCSKIILYKKEIPKISLLEVNCKILLRHQDILGTIFSLGLKEDTFGDILKYNNKYYIFVLPPIKDYLIYNLTSIKNNKVILSEVDLSLKDNFHQEYKFKEIIVSSLRIDNIVSTLCNDSRAKVIERFKNKEIVLNYNEEIKPTRILRENDIFSIRKIGKFKYIGIIKSTKKGGYIIKIAEYI